MPKFTSPIPDLAKAVGYHTDSLYKITATTSTAGKQLGRLLELATGVDRRMWQYPDEFGDPWEAWRQDGCNIHHVPDKEKRGTA